MSGMVNWVKVKGLRHIKKIKFHISRVRKGNGFNIITADAELIRSGLETETQWDNDAWQLNSLDDVSFRNSAI